MSSPEQMTAPNSFSADPNAGGKPQLQELKLSEISYLRDLQPDLRAEYVLANGSMSSNQSGEGEVRKIFIEADFVDHMVALTGQLFYIPEAQASFQKAA